MSFVATIDTWGDWDNEEYTGSLADTKVFTPSAAQSAAAAVANGEPTTIGGAPAELAAPPGLEQTVPNPPLAANEIVQQYSATVVSSTATAGAVAAVNSSGLLSSVPTIGGVQLQQQQQQQNNQVQYPEINAAAVTNAAATTSVPSHLRQTTVDLPQQLSAASLSAEQSQYFNSLSSQNSTQQQQAQAAAVAAAQQQQQQAAAVAAQQQAAAINAYQVPVTVQYPVSGYVTAGSTYGEVVAAQQAPQARKPRARVPPPSKIPATAVEMPGDSLNTIGYLDVQFGGLDFGTDDSFDSLGDNKFSSSSLDNSGQNVSSAAVDVSGGGDYNQSVASVVKHQQQQQSSPLGHQQPQNTGLAASVDALSVQNDNSLYAAANNQRSVSNVGVQQQQQQQQHAPSSVSLNNSGL